jgi:hypothetical protein
VSGQFHALDDLHLGRNFHSHWVGPRGGVVDVKRTFLITPGIELRSLGRLAIMTELPLSVLRRLKHCTSFVCVAIALKQRRNSSPTPMAPFSSGRVDGSVAAPGGCVAYRTILCYPASRPTSVSHHLMIPEYGHKLGNKLLLNSMIKVCLPSTT